VLVPVLVLGGPLASWSPALRLAARASRFAAAHGERLAFLLANRCRFRCWCRSGAPGSDAHTDRGAPPYSTGVTTALLLVDHGSRRAEANALLEQLAELVRTKSDGMLVRVAHMELAAPSIAEGFEACVQAGADEVVIVPCFLTPGRHATEDVPRIAAEAAACLGVRWRVADVLGVHPLLAELVLVRAGLR
jgi:hypothetical protein